MESAIIFVISAIRGCRAGAICAYSDISEPDVALNKTITTACEAVRTLIKKDKVR